MPVLGGLGALTAGLTWAALWAERSWPAHLEAHLALYLLAGLAWALTLSVLPRMPTGQRQLALIFAVSVVMRIPAWMAPPHHSDDVNRYLWEGRVQRAGHNPYLEAPEAPALAPLRDDGWARVSYRNLPTVYPPGAQLAFGAAAALPLPPLVAWKLLVAVADLGLLALLGLWLARRGADPRAALAWGWSPLAVIELAQEAHLDGLGVLAMVAAIVALGAGRRALAGGLLGLGAALKLLPVLLLLRAPRPRVLLGFALAAGLAALPFANAGWALKGSLGEFGRRWRGNEGAYALVHELAVAVIDRTPFSRRQTLDEAPRLARFVSGRHRDQVYPDEAVGLLARALSGMAFLSFLALLLARRPPPKVDDFAYAAVGGFLLLTPTLHPWYVLWIVPFLTHPRPAFRALATLVPLGYVPLAGWLAGGPWRDPVWTRLLEHGTTWALLAWEWKRPPAS
jgi:hypothetical protein